jgi:hypothetical protein
MIGLGIGINAYGTTSAQAQAVREAYLAFRARVLADSGGIPSPSLAQAFLRAVYSQSLQSSLVFAGLPAYKTTTGLVDKWYDLNGNDGVGTTTTRPTLTGFAPDFDGTDDYIEVPHNANQLLTGGGCLMAWVKMVEQDGVAQFIIDKSTAVNSSNGYRFNIRPSTSPGGISFTINNGTIVNSDDGVITPGVWYHVCAVFTALGVTVLYVDGEIVGSGTTGAASGITTTNAPRFGNRSTATDRPLFGQMALPSLFNSQPTQAQIRAIFAQTARYFA